jgi:hypothetical protein
MSKIEVDAIEPQSGTTLTVGASGDTVTVPSGVTFDASNSTLTLPDGSVSLAKLSATGTKDATTFLRGDNTFAEAGGGKVLQVVSSNFTTGFADTTLSAWTTVTDYEATITPSLSSSTILVNFNFNVATGGAGAADILRQFKVVKTISATTTDDSPLHTDSVGSGVAATVNNIRSNFDKNGVIPITIQYVSTPSTTSAVTYNLQFYGIQAGSVYINRATTNPSGWGEGASTITLMEISA